MNSGTDRPNRTAGQASRVPDDVAPLPRLLVPRLPDGLVARPRIADRVEKGVHGPLTLVCAPAGTGKTVAVASWLVERQREDAVVWISVGHHEATAAAFWPLLTAALRRAGVDVPGTVDDGLVRTLPVAIAQYGEDVVVVLDCDAELPQDIATGLHELLQDSLNRLHLVVLARSDPLLPLHLYRLRGELVEVRMADLAFTDAEARALFDQRGTDFAPEVFDAVMERTQGWVAGLLLSAMSIVHRYDGAAAVRELSGASGTVAEYLLSEVLDVQAPAVRALLLRASVVDVLRPGLVEELAGPRAYRTLTVLARGNAFLDTVPGAPECFAFHPLFRELLSAQLTYEAPAEVAALRRRAAGWLAEHGFVADAVAQAALAKAWSDVTAMLVDTLAVVALAAESAGDLRELVARLPDEVEGVDAELVRSAAAIGSGDVGAARARLDRVEAAHPVGRTRGCALAVLAALAAAADGAPEAPRLVEKARAELAREDPDRVAGRPELVPMVNRAAGAAWLAHGGLEEAATSFAADVETGWPPGFELDEVDCLGLAAVTAAWRGQSRRAVTLAERSLARARAVDPGSTRRSTATPDVALALARADQYDIIGARRHAQAAVQAGPPATALLQVTLAIAQARVRRARGEIEAARAALAEAEERLDDAPGWLVDEVRVEKATLELVTGRPDKARMMLRQTMRGPAMDDALVVTARARVMTDDVEHPPPSPLTRSASLVARVQGGLVAAHWQLRRGNEAEAVEALRRSLRLAAPEQLRRPFREAAPEVRRLFRERQEIAADHGWLATTRDGPPRGTRRRAGGGSPDEQLVIVEPLTAKEVEVLTHLAELMTTEEVAASMFVSVNTVRTHVRNILRKLSASRRNEAIRRARELRILPA